MRAALPALLAVLLAAAPAAAQEEVRELSWQEASDLVLVSCVFKSRPEGLEVIVERRAGVEGALTVSLPAGTFGSHEGYCADEGRPERPYQDLLLLRAPTLQLDAGQMRASVVIPVACGTYRRAGPEPGARYDLASLPAGSGAARLLETICAMDRLPPEQDLALALWITREDLSWDYLRGRTFHSFGQRLSVNGEQAAGAAALIEASGQAPAAFRFYRELAPAEAPEEAPEAPTEEPGPPDAQPGELS
jgi:hypothetical protein